MLELSNALEALSRVSAIERRTWRIRNFANWKLNSKLNFSELVAHKHREFMCALNLLSASSGAVLPESVILDSKVTFQFSSEFLFEFVSEFSFEFPSQTPTNHSAGQLNVSKQFLLNFNVINLSSPLWRFKTSFIYKAHLKSLHCHKFPCVLLLIRSAG